MPGSAFEAIDQPKSAIPAEVAIDRLDPIRQRCLLVAVDCPFKRELSKKYALFRVADESCPFVACKIRVEMEFIILEAHAAEMPNARRFGVRNEIIEEEPHAFDSKIPNRESMRAVLSGRDILSLTIFSVPCRRKRVGPNVEFINVRLAIENPDKFSLRIVDAEADCSIERRREEADAHASLA